jgi:outer membrane lipoprotein carrier protein
MNPARGETMRRILTAALLAVTGLGLAGCGRDDTPAREAQDGATPATPVPAAFGDTVLSGDAPVTDTGVLPPPVSAPPTDPGVAPPSAGAGSPPSPGAGAPPDTRGTAPATPPPAGSGTQPDASRILQEASDRYAEVRTLRANFTMRTVNPLLRSTTISRGVLHQQRPDRIALRFTDPDGDVMLADGRYLWAYYPSVNAQQVMRSPAGAAGSSGVDLQAQFLGDPVRRFEHTFEGREGVGGRDAFVLTLVPRVAADFSRLRVWVDAQDRLVRRFTVTETNGVERTIELENLQTNVTVPAGVFDFTPPPGARVIERG